MIKKAVKGEVTVFLSLVFVLLLSFVGAVIESASIQTMKNSKRGDMDIAMESVFAEYNQKLLEQYDVFALDAGYEGIAESYDAVLKRLSYYGAGDIPLDITRIQLLTDQEGRAFLEQAQAYMKVKTGLAYLEEITATSNIWKEQETKGKEYEQEQKEADGALAEGISKGEPLNEEDNPLGNITHLKSTPLLELVCGKSFTISKRSVDETQLPSHRTLNRGIGSFKETGGGEIIDKILFSEYLMEHFRSAQKQEKEEEGGALSYELEYMIAGGAGDPENLETVVKKLMLVRSVPNYAHLISDSQKQAEASTLALTVSTLLFAPELSEVVKQAILWAWAYGESVMDIRTLLQGGRVPLLKSAESWQLSLSGLLTLGTKEDEKDGADDKEGMRYTEYLRMLLLMEKKEELTVRALDMIEQNIRKEAGNTSFRVDFCISKMEIQSIYQMRRGIKYEFKTAFRYQ